MTNLKKNGWLAWRWLTQKAHGDILSLRLVCMSSGPHGGFAVMLRMSSGPHGGFS